MKITAAKTNAAKEDVRKTNFDLTLSFIFLITVAEQNVFDQSRPEGSGSLVSAAKSPIRPDLRWAGSIREWDNCIQYTLKALEA